MYFLSLDAFQDIFFLNFRCGTITIFWHAPFKCNDLVKLHLLIRAQMEIKVQHITRLPTSLIWSPYRSLTKPDFDTIWNTRRLDNGVKYVSGYIDLSLLILRLQGQDPQPNQSGYMGGLEWARAHPGPGKVNENPYPNTFVKYYKKKIKKW